MHLGLKHSWPTPLAHTPRKMAQNTVGHGTSWAKKTAGSAESGTTPPRRRGTHLPPAGPVAPPSRLGPPHLPPKGR